MTKSETNQIQSPTKTITISSISSQKDNNSVNNDLNNSKNLNEFNKNNLFIENDENNNEKDYFSKLNTSKHSKHEDVDLYNNRSISLLVDEIKYEFLFLSSKNKKFIEEKFYIRRSNEILRLLTKEISANIICLYISMINKTISYSENLSNKVKLFSLNFFSHIDNHNRNDKENIFENINFSYMFNNLHRIIIPFYYNKNKANSTNQNLSGRIILFCILPKSSRMEVIDLYGKVEKEIIISKYNQFIKFIKYLLDQEMIEKRFAYWNLYEIEYKNKDYNCLLINKRTSTTIGSLLVMEKYCLYGEAACSNSHPEKEIFVKISEYLLYFIRKLDR